MLLDSCKIEYKGLSPDEEIKNIISDLVEKIYANSPSDSNILFGLEKIGDRLKASCRISARDGFFEADAAEDSLLSLCQALEDSITQQLSSWKETRFI